MHESFQWKQLLKQKHLWVLLFFWIISRQVLALYYIADPDSLRFALASIDFDPMKAQPHFPLYPVFVFLSKLSSMLCFSYARGFALIGALSGFIITIASFFWLNWWKLKDRVFQWRLKEYLLAGLIFMNPLIGIMSTRYMPDLLGLALLALIFGLYRQAYESESSPLRQVVNPSNLIFFMGFFLAILLGVRLSYIPFCLPLILFINRPSIYRGFTTGLLLWLTPLLFWVSPFDLLDLANAQSEGHFQQFGGSILTQSDLWVRVKGLFMGLWGAGFNGYWSGRLPVLWIHGVPILSIFIGAIYAFFKHKRWLDRRLQIFFLTPFLTYFIWIFIAQNIVFKVRHQMPLVLLLCFVLVLSLNVVRVRFIVLCLSFSFFSCWLFFSSIQPVAIAQVKNQLELNKLDLNPANVNSPKPVILCVGMVGHFLERQSIQADYVLMDDFVNPKYEIQQVLLENYSAGKTVYLVGNKLNDYYSDEFISKTQWVSQVFYHNPWSNPVWPQIYLHQFKGFHD